MKNKTSYCKHSLNCDREENCKDGEYCPFFDAATLNPEAVFNCQDIAKEELDKIWQGTSERK